MSATGDARLPVSDGVISICDRLLGWLRDSALPLWDAHGVDRRLGGYFESLAFDSHRCRFVSTGGVRRGRVVARQIFVFDVAHRIGWRSGFADAVAHGRDYLFRHLHRGDGLFHTAVDAGTGEAAAPFSLYEHAFYLFALARLSGRADRHSVDATALRCLDWLRSNMGRAEGGFQESDPPTLPLKSNPHMHLLEAALAWIELEDQPNQEVWVALAREIVELCLTRFVQARTGAVCEYFDYEWNVFPDDTGRIIEPGHQFEWAWLLMQWASSDFVGRIERASAESAAARLMEIGEMSGVDPRRGVAINEIWDDMSVKDPAAKIWPQTERLKAWCAMFSNARTSDVAEHAGRHIVSAGMGLLRYLSVEPAGLWHEVWSADGSFQPDASKASSFYHIVCAIDVLRQTVQGRPGPDARPIGPAVVGVSSS